MGMNLDFSSVAKREPLAEGIYNLRCAAAEMKTSQSGKPMIAARFIEPETNTAIFENFVLTPDCLWKLQGFCNAVGIDASGNVDTDELIGSMLGLEVQAKVTQREYNGQVSNNIKSYIMG